MIPGPLMLIALIGAHFYFDYAGQGDFMAKAKNVKTRIPEVQWNLVMCSHAAIHGAAAALITGLWWVFFAETVIHAVTDTVKCEGRITFGADQFIHVACKVAWFACALWFA